jgi:hypothetical protein
MKTAQLVGIDQNPGSKLVFADVQVSDGTWMFEVAFSYEGGKYQALWQLAQRLTECGIEVAA